MNITEIMTKDVETCDLKSSCGEVANLMKQLDVGAIPICEGNKLVGLVTDRDLVVKGLANNCNAKTPIAEIVKPHVITGTKEMSLEQVAEIMSRYQIRRLPIMEGDKLIGIVSLGDIATSIEESKKAGTALEGISTSFKTKN
ncbi:CBS domain-containing protein [Priestia sp. SIMBA_032]|uniref:CBS domain-containing protein n=1 Tax=Priestia sp. SIMBA_032 TaxID=3085775 RepID=UPI00397D7363